MRLEEVEGGGRWEEVGVCVGRARKSFDEVKEVGRI
jgi:hypothetical protein